MKNTSVLLTAFVAFAMVIGTGFVGCSATDPKLWAPEHALPPTPTPTPKPTPPPTSEKGGVIITSSNPKVDILFVIDDSSSMDIHQQELSQNVGRFVQQFLGNSQLDYHIGVTTSTTNIEVDWPQSPYSYGDGKLMGYPTFVDRNTPNALSILQQKMVVGTGGNGHERFFVPVQEALTEPNLSGPNNGFYRPDAYLAIVMITDATDPGTVLSVSGFEQFLRGLKPGAPEKLLNYAVLIPSSMGNYPPGCDRDPDGSPETIEQYISDMKGSSFYLCDPNFGQKLADMGKDLVTKVTVAQNVLLSRKPIENTIQVTFGTQIIPRDPLVGWMYDPTRVALVFGPKLVWSPQPSGTTVQVNYTPVTTELPDTGN